MCLVETGMKESKRERKKQNKTEEKGHRKSSEDAHEIKVKGTLETKEGNWEPDQGNHRKTRLREESVKHALFAMVGIGTGLYTSVSKKAFPRQQP